MAHAIALVPDLLFGSRLQGALHAAGIDLTLVGEERLLREQLAEGPAQPGEVLILDLSEPEVDGAELLRRLRAADLVAPRRTLGFYAHVDVSVRERAEAAGFDLVVPRSRIAREGAVLVQKLAGGGARGPSPDG